MRIGIVVSIDSGLLGGFNGLELVRIPAEPVQDYAVDFWIASLTPATSHRQWPHLKGVRAVQGLWAGVDALRPLIPADVVLCNARGVHDAPTAEWAVTAVLAMQKYLYFYADLQRRADWAGKDKAEDIYLLSEGAVRDPDCPVLVEEVSDKIVLIVGYGSIGKAVEVRLTPFGCNFLRVARSARRRVAGVGAGRASAGGRYRDPDHAADQRNALSDRRGADRPDEARCPAGQCSPRRGSGYRCPDGRPCGRGASARRWMSPIPNRCRRSILCGARPIF